MNRILLSLFAALVLSTQAFAGNTLLATLQGSNGTTCKLYKIAGSTIALSFVCDNDGVLAASTASLKTTATSITTMTLSLGQGDVASEVACSVVANPTTLVYTLSPIIGTIPILGAGWVCQTGSGSPVVVGTTAW